MKLRNIIREYFTLNKRETKEILVLAFIILSTIVFSLLTDFFIKEKPINLSTADSMEIQQFLANLEQGQEEPYLNRLDQFIIKMYDTIQLFEFDPNTTTLSDLKKLGLTEKQAGNVISYREKGGKFFEKDDFRKIYSIRHKQYQILEPYIKLNISKQISTSNAVQNIEKFAFNPNTISIDSLKLLGLTDYQARNVINYREKVKSFKKKSDLQKVYGIDSAKYLSLENYINLPENIDEKPKTNEINQIEASELIKFFEVEAKLAFRIINFRNNLGGFFTKQQLFEVYEADSIQISKLINLISINPSYIKKININDSSAVLKRHPYIKYKNINRIEQYKLQHKRFNSLEEIKGSGVFLPSEWSKIQPYLNIK
jgi:DNA uptake protein ComE-like DNA-binding protein